MSSNAEQKARVLARVLRCLTVAAGSAAVSLGPQAAGLAGAAGPNCPDIEVVFARGTFEPPGVGATGQAFVDALDARLPGNSVEIYGVDYPASLDFAAAENGIADAANKIEAITANCPNTNVVLGGYSQGAAVAGYTTEDAIPAGITLPDGLTGPMPPATADHVAAVVLFGTPSDGFLSLVDHSAPPITIGNRYTAKILELCAPGDPVCAPGGLDRAAHSAYQTNGMTDEAAGFVATHVHEA